MTPETMVLKLLPPTVRVLLPKIIATAFNRPNPHAGDSQSANIKAAVPVCDRAGASTVGTVEKQRFSTHTAKASGVIDDCCAVGGRCFSEFRYAAGRTADCGAVVRDCRVAGSRCAEELR